MSAAQVPLVELLLSCPKKAQYKQDGGTFATSYWAVGAMCHEAAAEIARLTAELADEKAVVDVLRSELQDRLQKQRAAEAELQEVRKAAALPMSETALEAAAKVMAEAFDYPWEHMPTVGRINMRTIAKNVIDAAMTKEKP